jgi:glycosyltransferase 2 family protein
MKSSIQRSFWWARLVITIGLVVYLASLVWDNFNHNQVNLVNVLALLEATGAVLAGIAISVLLWQLMIPRQGAPGFWKLTGHYVTSLFYGQFLPGAVGGDLLRTGFIWQEGEPLDVAINGVFMARLEGLWAIALLSTLMVPFGISAVGLPQGAIFITVSLAGVVIALLVSAVLFGAPLGRFSRFLPAGFLKWHRGLKFYWRQPRLLIKGLVLALLIQACGIGVNTWVAQALGLAIPGWMFALVIPVASLSIMLPLTIGGLGVREGVYMYILGILGVSAPEALLVSLAAYLLVTLVSAIGAFLSIWLPKPKNEETCAS